MPKATSAEIMAAIASQLQSELSGVIPDLQVVGGKRLISPTPPAIDVYAPDDEPFYTKSGMGGVDYDFVFFVRARITPADQPAAEELLVTMMDPNSPESIARALESDTTLGGKAQDVSVDAPAAYGRYEDPNHAFGLLGNTWRTVVTV